MRLSVLPQVLLLSFTTLLVSSGPLVKRDPGNGYEITYLTDCESPNNLTSQLSYYLDWSQSFNGEHPIGWAQLPSRAKWENNTNFAALRRDKLDFQTISINPYADKLNYLAFAGIQNTSYGVKQPCFKDNGHLLFTNDPPQPGKPGAKCYSKYFCIDAATFGQFETCYMPSFTALAPKAPKPVTWFF